MGGISVKWRLRVIFTRKTAPCLLISECDGVQRQTPIAQPKEYGMAGARASYVVGTSLICQRLGQYANSGTVRIFQPLCAPCEHVDHRRRSASWVVGACVESRLMMTPTTPNRLSSSCPTSPQGMDDVRSRVWCPKEIKSADGQVRLSSVYGRSAVLE
jgi:hypothetical protein